MKLAQRMSAIKPSPTFEITAKAAAMRAQGLDIIGLGAGEPDFDTPDPIKKAGIEAIQKGHTKYTPVDGIVQLKEAIVAKMAHDNNLSYKPAEVMVSAGAKQVLFNAFLATLDRGDEVIIPAPYWVSYPDMVCLALGTPVVVECSAAQQFKLTPDTLKKAITPRTKWLVLNSPNNPTGMAYTKQELLALGEVLKEAPHVHVICDDIYEYLVYDGFKLFTLPEVMPGLKERTLVVNGVSKGYAMTGWRIGWGCGPAHIIAAMKNIQSQSTSNPTSISQHASVAALTQPRDFFNEWRRAFAERRDYVVAALNACRGIDCMMPQGAFYAYPSCAGVLGLRAQEGHEIQSDQDFAQYLLSKAQVAVVPGSAFGLSPYFRISYATSMDNLKKACGRIKKACAELES